MAGRSADDSPALFRRTDGQVVGSGSADGRVWGTYLHGVFDADAVPPLVHRPPAGPPRPARRWAG